MLNNIDLIDNLRSLARAKSRDYETRSVHPKLVEENLSQGWTFEKEQKTSVRLKRQKSHAVSLEDKVWYLFSLLSQRCYDNTV